MKRLNIIFISLLAMVCTVLSCSDDSVEDKDIQKIDPVGQLEVYKTSREKEILVKFIRTNYVKDIQIEIAYRNTESGENGEWTTIVLNGDNYKYGGNYLLQVPAEGTYEVAITLIGANELRSESKSQLASTFEYVKTSMFDCAHSMMTCVIKYYYQKGPRTCWQTYYPKEQGYWDGDAVVWGQGGGLSAFVALREASVDTEQEEYYRSLEDDMFKGIQHFWVTDHGRTAYSVYPDSGNDRFYDDNVWIGLDMAKWYAISKDVRYLNQAKAVWDYLSQYGWDNTCGGGVHWKELNEPSKSKHTCSTAPTGVLSCKLYQLTHEQKYLDKAIECFNWLQAYMQDPSDHLYYDNVSPDPEDPTQPGRMETNKYSYNSGQPLQLACLLYKITKNESYLTAAHQIAEACHKKWFTSYHSEVLQRDFNILAPGHAWFNTVMCRGFFELYSIDKNPSYLEDVRNTMLHAWFGKAHHISGLINDEDLSGAVSMNKWEILRQASLVELYALLAIWESGKDQTVLL